MRLISGVVGSTRESSLSVISDRLLVHHTDNLYVFNLRNATWTKWEIPSSTFNFNYFLRVPQRVSGDDEKYYAGSRLSANRSILEWRPDYPNGVYETMNCYVVTKVYDFNVPYTFKRMFWWGIDMLNKSNLNYTVTPVQYKKNATHEELHRFMHNELNRGTHLQPLDAAVVYQPVTSHDAMHAYTHDQLHLGTHLSPLGIEFQDAITETIKIDNVAENRMFIKLLKGLRFRQIYFTVGGTNDGSLSHAPFRIYTLTAFIDDKQLVAKKVS